MSEPNVTPSEQIDEFIVGLTAIRDWMDNHPEIVFAVTSVRGGGVDAQIASYGAGAPERFAAATRALMEGAPLGSIHKDMRAESSLATVRRDFGATYLDIYTHRAAVCEKVVVGTETVAVPDPAAPLINVEREIIRWDCSPILADKAVTS